MFGGSAACSKVVLDGAHHTRIEWIALRVGIQIGSKEFGSTLCSSVDIDICFVEKYSANEGFASFIVDFWLDLWNAFPVRCRFDVSTNVGDQMMLATRASARAA